MKYRIVLLLMAACTAAFGDRPGMGGWSGL